MNHETPQTLLEAVAHFSKPDAAFNFMVGLRWPNGVRCPRCDSTQHSPRTVSVPTKSTARSA